jgi:hypothetical protein
VSLCAFFIGRYQCMGLKEDPDFDFNGFERSDWEFEKVILNL